MLKPKPETPHDFINRYPAVTAHIIAESLGYAPPLRAAQIGLDGLHGKENWCEWIYSCYKCDARQALQDSIKNRHTHKGFMADYKHAKKLVAHYIDTGNQPHFASWF